ncbi:RNA polymerase sigma factor [Bacillus phage vB_BsuM-Goe19]|nr:RNA polymerase sigma factor [Bacillus phage vB_BsuM-Goe19]
MAQTKKDVGLYLHKMSVKRDEGFNNEEYFQLIDQTEDELEKEKLREKIFMNTCLFVKHYIRKYVHDMNTLCQRSRTTSDEFYSVAYLALWVAVQSYDVNVGVKFSTYAYKIIQNQINKYIVRSINRLSGVYSLQTPAYDNDESESVSEQDLLVDPVDYISSFENLTMVDTLLKDLSRKFTPEKADIFFAYTLRGGTQTEIAKEFGCSQVHVSRVVSKIQEYLRNTKEIWES